MKVGELITQLGGYNPQADILVLVNNSDHEFKILYGYSEGTTKETCECVSLYVEELNTSEETDDCNPRQKGIGALRELEGNGFVFLDYNNEPFNVRMLDGKPWLCNWNQVYKCFTTLRECNEGEILHFLTRKLPDNQAKFPFNHGMGRE